MNRGLVTKDRAKELRTQAKNDVRDALKNATGELLPPIDYMFDDVYEELPNHLKEQKEDLRKHLRKYPKEYSLEKFKDSDKFIA